MNGRIAGYDLARSLALFWLVVVNFGVGVVDRYHSALTK